ncbi:hypothetical protein BsWGS_10598 [Bradybaena similaris]
MSSADPPEFTLHDTDLEQASQPPAVSIRPDNDAVTSNTEHWQQAQQQKEEDKEDEDADVAPRRAGFFQLVVKYYWIAFGVVLSLELLGVVLSAIFSLNNKLFPFDFQQVPVEIKTDTTYQRDLAFKLRLQDPHLIIPENEKKFYVPYAEAEDDLSLIYRGDNVLTRECLQAIRDVELWMTNSSVWANSGLADDAGNIRKPDSIIRFFDGTHRQDLNDSEFSDIPKTLLRASSDTQLKATLQTFLAKDAVISATEARSRLTRSVFIISLPRIPGFRRQTFWKDNFGDKLENLANNGKAGMAIFFYTDTVRRPMFVVCV